MMKYEKPEAEITMFHVEDIIMASNLTVDDADNDTGWGELQ